MNAMQEARNTMRARVLECMSKYESLWAGNPAIVQIVADLRANGEAMIEVLNKQNVSISGIADDKEKFRINLTESAMKIMGAIRAYATVVNELEVFKKFNIPLSTLDVIRDTEFPGLMKDIQDYLAAHAAELEPYGVTTALGDLFNQQRADFSAYIAKPGEAVSSRSEATINLKVLLREMTDILKKRLDSAMMIYRGSQQTFYIEYLESRKIINNPSRPLSLKGVVTDEASGLVLELVKVRVVQQEAAKFTGKKGVYRFQGLEPGKVTVCFEKTGYELLERRVIIRKEATVNLDVALAPEPGV